MKLRGQNTCVAASSGQCLGKCVCVCVCAHTKSAWRRHEAVVPASTARFCSVARVPPPCTRRGLDCRIPPQEKNIKHGGNISFDDVIEIARVMRPRSCARDLTGTIREILGTAVSVGCKVNGQHPSVLIDKVRQGPGEAGQVGGAHADGEGVEPVARNCQQETWMRVSQACMCARRPCARAAC